MPAAKKDRRRGIKSLCLFYREFNSLFRGKGGGGWSKLSSRETWVRRSFGKSDKKKIKKKKKSQQKCVSRWFSRLSVFLSFEERSQEKEMKGGEKNYETARKGKNRGEGKD